MKHNVDDEDADGESTYECLECGALVTDDSHPVECPDCGAGMQGRSMSLE